MRRLVQFFWGPCDPRTYALVRIFLSFAGLINLIDLWPHRYEYCASSGMIPLDVVRSSTRDTFYRSVFLWVTSERGVDILFIAAALALIAFGVGILTRASAWLVFVWNVSYSVSAYPVLHSWDSILRIYSFIMLFSPTGRAWSVDHRLRPRESDGQAVPVYGLRLMQFQLYVLYLTTFWLKTPDVFWHNGQFIAYFSVSLYSRTPNNLFLVRHEWLSAIATFVSIAIEGSVPWLLSFRRTRPWGMLAGFALHFMIAVTAKLAIFSVCMLAPYVAFLDGRDIDWLVARIRRKRAASATFDAASPDRL